MITGVAFVPQAPALDPEVGRGLDVELGPLRQACRAAIRGVGQQRGDVVVLADAAGAGIGRWLVADALGDALGSEPVSIAPGVSRPQPIGTLVVVGDGSARRTEKAPGYLDQRAAGFDAGVAAALAGGDAAALAGLDETLGAELLAAGVPAWRTAAAWLAGTSWHGRLLYDDAPFGVGYLVAVWTPRA